MKAFALAMLLGMALGGPPNLGGLATHYDRGTVFRSGEPFRLDSPTCAVDVSEWPRLRGCMVMILTEGGRVAVLRVNDSGYLYRAGRFAWDVRQRGSVLQARYWPSAHGQRIVLDLPRETFRRLSPDLETQRVWVWVIGCGARLEQE